MSHTETIGEGDTAVDAVVYDDPDEFLHDATTSTSAKKEGEVWVGVGGTYFIKPFIDYQKLFDMLKNNYVTEHLERLRSLIFIDEPVYKVFDPQGEEDTDLSLQLKHMCEEADVDIWSNMQKSWIDITGWGCAIYNPIWKREGPEARMTAMRRLPPESFGPETTTPKDAKPFNFSEILRGIYLDNDGEKLHFVQTGSDGQTHELKNICLMKDPISTEMTGTSKMLPIIPILSMLDFAWQAEMQKVNRTGAPILFIKFPHELGGAVVDGDRDDFAYANKILTNWGKNTAYTLRENMEIVKLEFTDNQSALETIEKLEGRLRQYFMPATLIQREGNTIGDSGDASMKLLHEYIKGQHNRIEKLFEPQLEPWLTLNMFEGYTLDINIPEPRPDDTDVRLKIAQMGLNAQALTTNEIRELLGKEPFDDMELEELRAEHEARTPSFPGLFKGDEHIHAGPDLADPLLEDEIKKGAADAQKKAQAAYEAEVIAVAKGQV